MNNFSKRILSGIVYVCVFLFAILFSKESYIGLITFFSIVSLWEFSRILKVVNVLPYMVLLLLSVIAYLGVNIYIPNKALLLLVIYTVFNAIILLIDLFSKEYKSRSSVSNLFLQIKSQFEINLAITTLCYGFIPIRYVSLISIKKEVFFGTQCHITRLYCYGDSKMPFSPQCMLKLKIYLALI